MTSLSPKQFKEEFRGRVTDFIVSGHLLQIGNKKPTEKEKKAEEMYLKLEKWVLGNMTIAEDVSEKEVTPIDILENGFSTQFIEEKFLEPDTNDPSIFPAEGNDLLDF